MKNIILIVVLFSAFTNCNKNKHDLLKRAKTKQDSAAIAMPKKESLTNNPVADSVTNKLNKVYIKDVTKIYDNFSYNDLIDKKKFSRTEANFKTILLNKDYDNYTETAYYSKEFDLKFQNLAFRKREIRNVYLAGIKLSSDILVFKDSVKFNYDKMLPYTYDELTDFYISKDKKYYLVVDIPDNSVGLFTTRYKYYQLIDISNKKIIELLLYDNK